MEALETYTSVLAVLSAALLLVAGGMAKKQLVWKRRYLRPPDFDGASPKSDWTWRPHPRGLSVSSADRVELMR
jgi:hypothetical protein